MRPFVSNAGSDANSGSQASPTPARYTDRSGAVIECVCGGESNINGVPVDYACWPTLENPCMQQPQGGSLTITEGRRRRVYDFQSWSIEETRKAELHKDAQRLTRTR